jgi:hypothetical protein
MRRAALLALLCAAAGVWASETNLPPSTPSENQPPSTPPSTPDAAAADAAAADAAAAAVQNPMPPPPPPPPMFIDWELLADNIITSSLLPGNKRSSLFRHGLTIESDTLALVAFFNNTAASYEARPFLPRTNAPMHHAPNAPNVPMHQMHHHPCTDAPMHLCRAPRRPTRTGAPWRG